MNENDFKILSLHEKIKKNIDLSKKLKVLAGTCLFFYIFYWRGSKNIGVITEEDILATNIVWIVSIIAMVGIFIKDSYCVKVNKTFELEIYRLEVEDLNDKKEIAKITGEVLPDNILNKQIDRPNEKTSLPIIFYSILLGLDIIVKFFLN